ncbi:MAG TPA: cupin domain-containing protein [Hyphomicrobiaceae bacterium]
MEDLPVKTVTPSPEEMKARTARFKDLMPYSKQQENTGIPVAAMERLTANKVYSIMVPEGYKGRSAMAPLKGLPGAVISIAECPPGNGPGLHAHEQTVENFFCLNGKFEVTWGDEGQHSMILEPLDFVSFPPKVSRAFRNISDETARLFVLIQPVSDVQEDRVAYAPKLEEELKDSYGAGTVEALKKIGFKFDAGIDA